MGEGDGCQGALSPLSGLICEIVNSIGQGNFTFIRKRSWKPLAVATMAGQTSIIIIYAGSWSL